MICRFEDRLAGDALVLEAPVERIAVHRQADLEQACARIEAARRSGHWTALLLDYELGEWLEPELCLDTSDTLPRLTALIHAQARHEAPWPAATLAAHPLQIRPRTAAKHHQEGIETIRAHIARGDYYQVNLSLEMDLAPDATDSPENLYRSLAARHPTAHAACIQDGERWVLSLSPELFVARQAQTLTVRPMKGTAPRSADPIADEQAGRELLTSAKNRAENLMIVDLLRNDLGRIARPGSVCTDTLFDLEQYPSVWTLTSTIRAWAPDAGLAEVLRALFPCGSVTGAPKIAAMRAIRDIERRRRGIYCGSVGWLAPNGDFSLNVAIRTIEIRNGRAVFGVGGGITYDSDPREEWEECLWKARVLRKP